MSLRLLAWLLIALAGLTGCAHTAPGGTIEHGVFAGQKRSWVRYDPPQPPAGRRPLLLALHGHGGDGEGMRRMTGLDQVAAENGFSVLYPDGLQRKWRDGRWPADGVDDVAFLAALIGQQLQTGLFDPRRVYVTGMSNGAFMTHALLCAHADLFAGGAPVAGGMSPQLLATCKPARPVPILLVNNTRDRLVPYDGGAVAGDAAGRGQVVATREAVRAWQRFNGLTENAADDAATAMQVRDTSAIDGTRAVILTFGGPAPRPTGWESPAPVQLARIEGGGHTWPGGQPYLPALVVGKVSRAWSASAGMWQFFAATARAPSGPLQR